MALVLKDRVKQDTTTAGTGTITLSGTYLGYQSFSAIGDGNTTYYCIAGQGTNEWEVGIGTYTAAGTTLSRDTILASSNSGSVVTFSAGTKDVFVVYPAGKSVYQDASGNVGIGTDSPATLLHVQSTNYPRIRVKRDGGFGYTDVISQYGNSGYFGLTSASGDYSIFLGNAATAVAIGADRAVPLIFGTNNLERMRLDASGNLSIGTATANAKLHVTGTNTGSATVAGIFTNEGLTAGSTVRINFLTGDDGTVRTRGIIEALSPSANSGALTFTTRNAGAFAECMRIDGVGNVGIGTTSPANRLDIVNSASSAQMSIAGSDGQFAGMFGGTGSNGPGIFFLNTAPALRFGTATTKALGSFAELMRLTAGGILGLGVTPSAWGAGNKAFEQIGGFLFSGAIGNIYLGNNTYFDGTNWIYKNTAAASYYQQGAGAHYWFQAASGTAGNTITFTERMRLDASGNLGIGTTSAGDRLSLGGAIRVTQDGSSVGVYLAGGLRHTGSSNFYIDSNTGGAAGNIIFRNGSGFAEQMRLDASGNLGLGVTPSAWQSAFKALELSGGNTFYSNGSQASLASNAFNDGAWKYKTTASAGLFANVNGSFQFFNAPSGTAGNAITFTQAMTLDASGNLGVGIASPLARLHVSGITGAGANSFLVGFGANGDNYYTTGASGFHVFRVGGSELMRLTNGGSLGLGTASPAYRLDVNAGVADFAARILNGGVSFSRQGLLLQGGNNTEFYGLSTRTADASCEFGFRIQAGSLPAVWSTTNHSIIFGNNNTERMRLDTSGNLGLGVTPSAWGATQKAIQVSTVGSVACDSATVRLVNNAYFDGTNWVYLTTTTASRYQQTSGIHQWFTAPSGTAGNAISFTQAMTLTASGSLGVGTTSPNGIIHAEVASGNAVIRSKTGGSGSAILILETTGIGAQQINANTGSVQNLTMTVAGSERLRIDASGNLGIGTSSPTTRLHVSGTGGVSSRGIFESTSTSPSSPPVVNFYRSDTTSMVNQFVGQISFSRLLTDSSSNTAATITAFGSNVAGSAAGTLQSDVITDYRWLINNSEQARLTTTGLGLGTTAPAQKLDVLGSGQFRPAATQDAVLISGRAGGTSSYAATITPTTLTANRTITLPDATTTVVGTDATQTLTNKRVNPRAVAAAATTGNLTPDGDTTDVYNAFGLTGAITLLTPSGTPVDGQRLMLRFEDNGTARGITWTTSSGAFRAVGITLPTTTVASKITYVGCVYNSTDVFWDAVATVTQA